MTNAHGFWRSVPAIALAAAAALSISLALLVRPAAADVVEIKAAHFTPPNTSYAVLFQQFVDKVNEEGEGLVKITDVLGPSAVPPFEMETALKNNVVQMINLPPGYYAGSLPEADATKMAQVSPAEMRQNGAWALLNRLHEEKIGAHLIAQYGWNVPFHIFLGDGVEVSSLDDLDGLKLRGAPTYRPFLEEIGATMIRTTHAEMYTAMERGVVDGYNLPHWDVKEMGLLPVTAARIHPPFYRALYNILINLDVWEGMSQTQRDVLTRVGKAFEVEALQEIEAINEREYKEQDEAGVKRIEFTGPDRERYLKAAHEAGWADLLKRNPEDMTKLQQLLTK